MDHDLVFMLAAVGIIGIGVQWLAWRLRVPGLILLIIAGLVIGPLSAWIDPSRDLGEVFEPVIALCVAVILFEGGLNLRWHELKESGAAINRLVTLGLLFTFGFASVAAHYVGGLSWPVATVFGAVTVVTGPTVIMPLLRQAKLQRRPAALLKWEGIVNDPVGALLAVLVFDYFMHAGQGALASQVFSGLLLAAAVAAALGIGAGYLLGWAFRQGHVPEFLKPPVLLGAALATYVGANALREESGLLAVTLLGVIIANQGLRNIDELRRFKEYITVLLIAVVFILLTADLKLDILARLDWRSAALLVLIIFVIRPLAVYLATLGANMDTRDRVLLAWIAPRGIVAAAVAGVFGPALADKGYAGAELLLPLVFALIFATVMAHGLSIGWLSRRLGLASKSAGGVLMAGASPWSVALALQFKRLGVPVLISDSSWPALQSARMAGIPTHHGDILSERAETSLELYEMTHLMALTPNEAYNALLCNHFAPQLGRTRVYEPAWAADADAHVEAPAPNLRGNRLFDRALRFEELMRRHYTGWRFHHTRLSDEFTYADLAAELGDEALHVATIDAHGGVAIVNAGESEPPGKGDTVISYRAPDTVRRTHGTARDTPS